MVRKTIKAILKKKVNDWINSIEDESLQELVKDNVIITGGAIVNLLNNEPPKDYDIYFRTKEVTKKVAEYYVNKFNLKNGKHTNKIGYKHFAFVLDGALDLEEQLAKTDNPIIGSYDNELPKRDWGSHMLHNLSEDQIKIIIRSDGVAKGDGSSLSEDEQVFEDVYDTEITGSKSYNEVLDEADSLPDELLEESDNDKVEKYRTLFISSNAITLSNKIQLVIRFHGEPEDIHKNFDYLHATCYWTSWDCKLELPALALESIINKQLVYQGSLYPLCSIMRMRKFIQRGWNINAGQILKMLYQISQLDLNDISILEEQLVGVDSAYFMQLIDALQKKRDKDESFELNTGYLNTILDKLFG